MQTKDILQLGLLGAVAYLLYKGFNFAKDTADKAVDTTSTAIANLWLDMFPLPPAMELLGNVTFPGNINVQLQQLSQQGAVRQDDQHRVFVKYAGFYWQLAPANEYGNWPATRVS